MNSEWEKKIKFKVVQGRLRSYMWFFYKASALTLNYLSVNRWDDACLHVGIDVHLTWHMKNTRNCFSTADICTYSEWTYLYISKLQRIYSRDIMPKISSFAYLVTHVVRIRVYGSIVLEETMPFRLSWKGKVKVKGVSSFFRLASDGYDAAGNLSTAAAAS
jgi:hypothetical protein